MAPLLGNAIAQWAFEWQAPCDGGLRGCKWWPEAEMPQESIDFERKVWMKNPNFRKK